MKLNRRSRSIRPTDKGYLEWQMHDETLVIDPAKLGIILCDVWDRHWCRGANERLSKLLPKMARTITSSREKGITIIHAPSETLDFYEGTPARQRILSVPLIDVPLETERDAPPLPVNSSDGGSDTVNNPGKVNQKLWTRQHPLIKIDHEKDVISDNGCEIYSYLHHIDISSVVIIGVHTNMCILNRSFAIKQMVQWGQDIMLCRDLTDAMYNPGRPPYVQHSEGTRLVIEYIEKFWCPSVTSEDLA